MSDQKISIGIVEILLGFIGTATLAVLGWISITLIDMKTDVAVTAIKVEENHSMLTTLWEDFITRKAVLNDIKNADQFSGIKASLERSN